MKVKKLIPALLWGTAILVITGLPGNYIPKADGFWELFSPDKIVHLSMFAPFAWLLVRGFVQNGTNIKKGILFASLIGIVYALLTELMQFYIIPGRNGNIYDAIADILGVIIGLYLFYRFKKN